MSFLINIIGTKIIDILESELIKVEPMVAQALLSEAEMVFGNLSAYATSKINAFSNANQAVPPVNPIPEVPAV